MACPRAPFDHRPSFTLTSILLLACSGIVLMACGGKEDESTGTPTTTDTDTDTDVDDCDESVDADCDGFADEDDCEPNDPYSYPGADDIPYDGVDNDCEGDGDLVDVDGDGFDGESAGGDDCNDGNPEVYPGAEEECYNGIDENCDGIEDTYDCDGDGHDGVGDDKTDCDDNDPEIHPDAEEVWYDGVDQDCTGIGSSDYDADEDGDDHEGYEEGDGEDCDDTDPETSSITDEVWDGMDRDCDDEIDALSKWDANLAYYANTSSGDGYFGMCMIGLEDYDGDGTLDIGGCGPFSGTADSGDTGGTGDSGETGDTGGTGSEAEHGWFHVLLTGAEDGIPAEVAYTTVIGDSYSWLSWDAAPMGDMNGDGYVEIALGAPLANDYEGVTLLFSGADLQAGGQLSPEDAIASASGLTYIGFDVANAGDIDQDGVDDLVSGGGSADYGTDQSMAVWSGGLLLLAGEAGMIQSDSLALIVGEGAAGETVGGADFDADGIPDLIVADDTVEVDAHGAVTLNDGLVAIIPGSDIAAGGILTISDYPLLIGDTGEGLGIHSAWLTDVDGDGLNDLVTSAPGAEGSASLGGAVYVLSATDVFTAGTAAELAITTINGTTDDGSLVVAGDGGGDLNGDGNEDLIVTHMGIMTAVSGTAHSIDGVDLTAGGSIDATAGFASFSGASSGDNLGRGTAILDVDANGTADVVLGAPGNNDVGVGFLFLSFLSDS